MHFQIHIDKVVFFLLTKHIKRKRLSLLIQNQVAAYQNFIQQSRRERDSTTYLIKIKHMQIQLKEVLWNNRDQKIQIKGHQKS